MEQENTLVLEGANVWLGFVLATLCTFDCGLDGFADTLHNGGDDDVLVICSRFVPIGVNTDHEDIASFLCSCCRTEADWACNWHDDVRTLLNELLSLGLTED